MQSRTFRDYVALSTPTSPEGYPHQNPHTDAFELEQLGAVQGLGYQLHDDAADGDDAELAESLAELGVPHGNDWVE